MEEICKRPRSASTGPTSSRPTSQTLSKTSPQLGGDHLRRQPGSKTSSQVGGDHHRREPGQPPPSRRLDLIKEVSLKDRELRIVGEVGAKIRVLDFISPDVQSECDGLEVVRNPKRPIGAWIHYYNDQLAMMKKKDKGVKINDDVRIEEKIRQEVECTFKSRKRKFHGKVQRKIKTIFTSKGCGSKGNFYFYIFRLDAPPSELLE
ncbi:hypothetical protein CK203_108550 [Vitis vinifera]|uniref:Uncharacterized protein n=1 Tax=Vitis vinifera TaxID=29760 RepID=A0A438FG64_VITVI|nr:hypothetical protein CK203_108550 [Vitis vinifera]